MIGLRPLTVILITASLSTKMNRNWMCVHSCEQNLDPRLITSRRCSLAFVVSSVGVGSGCPVLVVPMRQPQCPTECRNSTLTHAQRNDFFFTLLLWNTAVCFNKTTQLEQTSEYAQNSS